MTRSFKLVNGAITATGFYTVYTVPASYKVILKQGVLSMYLAGGTSLLALMYLANVAGMDVNLLYLPAGMADGQVINDDHWRVLESGDTLNLYHQGTGHLKYWFSGTLLPSP